MFLFYAALLLMVFSILLFWQAGRAQKNSGLPGGRIIYTDTRSWGSRVEQPLYDSTLGLTGKPDYIVEKNGYLIPVEVKSSRAPEAPYDSHIFQLASYCYLVEKTLGSRPPYGIIHYENRDFAIDYTLELENSLLETLTNMRADERRREVDRSHESSARCSGCGFRNVCEKKL